MENTKPGDLIQLGGSENIFMVFEEGPTGNLRIVNITGFEDMEYNTPMNNSEYSIKFKSGDFVKVGHISQIPKLKR